MDRFYTKAPEKIKKYVGISIKKGHRNPMAFQESLLKSGFRRVYFFLFNTGTLTNHIAKVEDACTTNLTTLIYIDTGQLWAVDREYTLYTYSTGDFANRERFGETCATTLQHNTLELLFAFLVSFDDFIVYSDRITGFKIRPLFLFY